MALPKGRLGQAAGGPFTGPGCVIFINSRYRFGAGAYATVILHETGHLAGYRPPARWAAADGVHSTNPRSVMAAKLVRVDPRVLRVGLHSSTRRFVGP